jgi:hypothetical protein
VPFKKFRPLIAFALVSLPWTGFGRNCWRSEKCCCILCRRDRHSRSAETTETDWQWLGSVVAAQRAYTPLRDVERTLDCMQDAGYGLWRGCRNDIPVSRLSVHPQATLCVGCIEEGLDLLAADAL